MASFEIQLQGHTPANRDVSVSLRNPATNQVVVRKPFLDGKLLVRDLDPGVWEMEVTHPNLIVPIDRRPIRLFPQPMPTLVPVLVSPRLFRDTPIRDIPDADLGPVQQMATAVRDRSRPLAAKASGEVIRAEDWNTMAGAVADLADTVLQLVSLVAPKGHDHPEIEEKIGEVQDNVRNFLESFGRSHLELRREIETAQLRRRVEDVVKRPQVPAAVRTKAILRLDELDKLSQADSRLFTQKLAGTANEVMTMVNDLAVDQPGLLDDEGVKELNAVSRIYAEAGTQSKVDAELGTYRRSSTQINGSKFGRALGQEL